MSSHKKRERERSPRGRDDRYDDDDQSDDDRGRSKKHAEHSATDYKQLYKDLKHELKRKKRDVEGWEEKYENERKETKKAKQDTQDLWKIYYQLQTELQQSYERNAKLSAEKSKIQKDLDEVNTEYNKIRGGAVDPTKLRDALMKMQKEKMDMQKRFNDIVMENKELREKELRYGPRFGEIEKAGENLVKVRNELGELTDKVNKARHDMVLSGFNKETVEKYQRWNSMLSLECDQNAYRLRQLESEQTRGRGAPYDKLLIRHHKMRSHLTSLLELVRRVKSDWRWTGDAVSQTIALSSRELAQCTLGVTAILDKTTLVAQSRNQPAAPSVNEQQSRAMDKLTVTNLAHLRVMLTSIQQELSQLCFGLEANAPLIRLAHRLKDAQSVIELWMGMLQITGVSEPQQPRPAFGAAPAVSDKGEEGATPITRAQR